MTNEELEREKVVAQNAFSLVEEGEELLGDAFAEAYQRALDFMNQGEYKKALNSAQMLESVEGYKKQAKMLKFRIFTTCAETFSEEDIALLTSLWNDAVSCCGSYEEFFSIYNDATLYVRNWLRKATQRSFAQQQALMEQTNLQEQRFPSEEVFVYFKTNYFVHKKIIDKMLEVPAFISLVENSDMPLNEATERYLIKRSNVVEIMYDESFKAGCHIFDKLTDFIEENKHCSAEYMEEIIQKAFLWYSVAYSDLKASGENDVWDEEKRRTAIRKTIDLCNYYLNESIYPNGRTISLAYYPRYRELVLKDLEECYALIQKLEPDFLIPTLPDKEPINEGVHTSSGGCYVATCVYGSYDCPQVWTLRRFRDNILAETWYGRAFIKTYYAVSPTLVKWFGNTQWFKKLWQGKLDHMVAKLQANGIESTPYEDKEW